MIKSFQAERKLFAAMESYLTLLNSIPSLRAYSGASRLYLMTGMGVTLRAAGDLTKLAENLAKDDILVQPPLAYIKSNIAANCATYCTMLSQVILHRLDTRETQDQPTNPGPGPRLSYNISARLSYQLEVLIEKPITQQLWDESTLFQNLAAMAQIEYAEVVRVNGRLLPNPRRDHTIRKFLHYVTDAFVSISRIDRDPRYCQMHLLTVVLIIARLLYADFDEIDYSPATGPLSQRLKISGSTLAALPWPSPEFVESFSESDAGFITTQGWCYLKHIMHIHPEQYISVS